MKSLQQCLAAMGTAQRTGSRVPPQGPGTGSRSSWGQSWPPLQHGLSPFLFISLFPHQALSIILFSSPGLRASDCSIADPPRPAIPTGFLGEAVSRAGASKEDPEWVSETSSFSSLPPYYNYYYYHHLHHHLIFIQTVEEVGGGEEEERKEGKGGQTGAGEEGMGAGGGVRGDPVH